MNRGLLSSSLAGLLAAALTPSGAADRADAAAAGTPASGPSTVTPTRAHGAAHPAPATGRRGSTASPASPARATATASVPNSLADGLVVVRKDCDTWARSQPLASSDGTIYQVDFEECMRKRGHAVR